MTAVLLIGRITLDDEWRCSLRAPLEEQDPEGRAWEVVLTAVASPLGPGPSR